MDTRQNHTQFPSVERELEPAKTTHRERRQLRDLSASPMPPVLRRVLFRAKRLRQWLQSTLIAREPVDSPSVNVSAKQRDRTLCALLAIVREIEIICLKAESENMTGFFQVAVQATQQQVRAAAQRIVLDTDAIMLNMKRHLVPFW